MVLNTKVKRTEFGTNVILIALFAVTGALMLLSAYGASCVAWDPAWYDRWIPMPPPSGTYMFAHVRDNLMLYQSFNVLTWVMAFGWIVVIYAFITQRTWGMIAALGSSVVSFVLGLTLAIISDTKNFTIPFVLGSPHWAKTIASGLVLITLVIVLIARAIGGAPIGQLFKTYTTDVPAARAVSSQLMIMSGFFLWFSFVSFLGTGFMANAHVVEGLNIWQLVEIQTIGGVATAIAGCSMLVGGGVMKMIKPPTSFTTTL